MEGSHIRRHKMNAIQMPNHEKFWMVMILLRTLKKKRFLRSHHAAIDLLAITTSDS